MKEKQETKVTISLSFSTWVNILGFTLVILKFANQIDWSWFWILAPWWGPLVGIFVAGFVYGLNESRQNRKKRQDSLDRIFGKAHRN